jgi:hypothetical protein
MMLSMSRDMTYATLPVSVKKLGNGSADHDSSPPAKLLPLSPLILDSRILISCLANSDIECLYSRMLNNTILGYICLECAYAVVV